MFIDLVSLGKIVLSVLGLCALLYIAIVGTKQNSKQHKGTNSEQATAAKPATKTETTTQTTAQK